jgi:hypothetical protein
MKTPRSIGLLLPVISVAVAAGGTSEEHEKQALLTLSAFECSAVAPTESEVQRLFMLGYKAGHEFIEYAGRNQDRYNELIRPNVPILWNTTSGPTPDFVLGRIYSFMVDDVYDNYVADEKQWKMKKDTMYRKKNCALLGK